MTTTAVRTFRLSHSIVEQLGREAERQKTTGADIVRLALSQYFKNQQTEATLLGLEQRLVARLDAHGQHLSAGLQKILSLAEPIQG
jgi:predicted transcriptional regulator